MRPVYVAHCSTIILPAKYRERPQKKEFLLASVGLIYKLSHRKLRAVIGEKKPGGQCVKEGSRKMLPPTYEVQNGLPLASQTLSQGGVQVRLDAVLASNYKKDVRP